MRGVSTLEVAHDSDQTLLHENDPVLFPSEHAGSSVSALATQMFFPVYNLKVSQLHLQCSHCNHTIMINSNHIGRLMHVAIVQQAQYHKYLKTICIMNQSKLVAVVMLH